MDYLPRKSLIAALSLLPIAGCKVVNNYSTPTPQEIKIILPEQKAIEKTHRSRDHRDQYTQEKKQQVTQLPQINEEDLPTKQDTKTNTIDINPGYEKISSPSYSFTEVKINGMPYSVLPLSQDKIIKIDMKKLEDYKIKQEEIILDSSQIGSYVFIPLNNSRNEFHEDIVNIDSDDKYFMVPVRHDRSTSKFSLAIGDVKPNNISTTYNLGKLEESITQTSGLTQKRDIYSLEGKLNFISPEKNTHIYVLDPIITNIPNSLNTLLMINPTINTSVNRLAGTPYLNTTLNDDQTYILIKGKETISPTTHPYTPVLENISSD